MTTPALVGQAWYPEANQYGWAGFILKNPFAMKEYPYANYL